ncbi:MAG TPA: hypothetical protein VGM57_15220 [Pseudolabrys sp.]|jgi:hypothetical protein
MLNWLRIVIIAGGVAVVGTSAGAEPSPARKIAQLPHAEMDMLRALPLAFYVAKGLPNACGEGCDTWIAADGGFDLGAVVRFKRFLKTIGHRSLPIFFNSPGGVVQNSMGVGRAMRILKMKAGVGKTTPAECVTAKLSDKACHQLKSSGRELTAELSDSGGICASACVYALIGASTREIAPGAILGIHAGLPVSIYSDGRVALGNAAATRITTARLRSYIAEMGVEPALLDAAEATSHDKIRVLTRDEIVRFRIDPRDTAETSWALRVPPSGRAYLSKRVLQAREAEGAGYLQRTLAISCAVSSANLLLSYLWQQDAGSLPNVGPIRVGIGGQWLLLQPNPTTWSNRNQLRVSLLSIERLKEAAKANAIYVNESQSSPLFTFSTVGLSDALVEFIKRCPGQ